MKYYPGGINNRAQAGMLQLMQLSTNRGYYLINRRARITSRDGKALMLKTLPDQLYQQILRINLPELLNPLLGDKPVHTG